MDWRSMSTSEFFSMFDKIYSPTKNLERDFHLMLALFVESIARISQYTTRDDHEKLIKYLPKVFAWYCGLVNKSGLKSIDDTLWKKYPCVCSYCLRSECGCHLPGMRKPIDYKKLAKFQESNGSHRPATLDEWQTHFQKIYPRYPEYDYRRTFAHLVEEVGEVSEAYRIRYFYSENLPHEMADVITWIIGIANLINAKQPESRVSLAELTLKTYPSVCEKCQKEPCKCPPEPLMKVSEPFYTETVEQLITAEQQKLTKSEDLQPKSVTINITESTIASLNLGHVLGKIETSITSLSHTGQEEIAKVFKELTEVVANSTELGEARQEVIEQLSELASQAQLPAQERKPGILKAVWGSLNGSLSAAASIAAI